MKGKYTKKVISTKSKKSMDVEETEGIYICPVCDNICEEEPVDREGESIGCDKCDKWYHYGCVNLTGVEEFLTLSASNWFCPSCCKKAKRKSSNK